jgi:hypothetical protein
LRVGGFSTGPVVHHRQVVIGPQPFLAGPDWDVSELDGGIHVSRCPSLRFASAQDRNGHTWALLGLALPTVEDASDPTAAIAQAHTEEIPRLQEDWAGRWLLVGDGHVHLDAGGLIGCFYGTDETGRCWASSSPALIRELILEGESPPLASELQVDSWYPPPRSRWREVKRLLPSQTLALAGCRTAVRPLLPPIDPDRGYEDSLALLGQGLASALRRLPADAGAPGISLSGGYDSRVVLAAAERAGISYTLNNRVSTNTSPADRLIPPRIASIVGRPLEVQRRSVLQRRRARSARLPLAMHHCAGHVAEGDMKPLLQGVRDAQRGISLGGWGFGIGGLSSWDKFPPWDGDREHALRPVLAALGAGPGSAVDEGLRMWLDWTEETPVDRLDWRDRFYIEQRMGGWQSSKEQLYDMLPLERIPIINCARFHALMLGIDESRRAGKSWEGDLVARLCPDLAGIPANPPVDELPLARVVATKLRDDPVGLGREAVKRLARR